MTRIFSAALLAFALLATAGTAADARSRHATVTCDKLGCSDWFSQAAPPKHKKTTQRRYERPEAAKRHSPTTIGATDPAPAETESAGVTPAVGGIVDKARRYVGMTARQIGLHRTTLWCSAFMRYVAGSPPGVDDRAISWSRALPHIGPRVGAIVVVSSRRMHVGVVSGFDRRGNPKVISGNHNNRVAESTYPRGAVIAYLAPPT
jgi:uncharacterized protein (TIGR02594 family)